MNMKGEKEMRMLGSKKGRTKCPETIGVNIFETGEESMILYDWLQKAFLIHSDMLAPS